MSSEHTPGLVTLDYVVAQVLDDIEMYDERKIRRYLNIARKGVMKLQMNVIKDVRSVILPVDESIKVANYPEDYLFYKKVAVVASGNIWTLTRNDRIPLITEQECGEEVNENTTQGFYYGYYGYASNSVDRKGSYIGRNYGADEISNIASFRPDDPRRRFQLQGTIPNNEIILEYVTTSIEVDGKTYIPRIMVDAVVAFVHWQSVVYNKKVSANEKLYRQQLWKDEALLLAQRKWSMTADEILDAVNTGSSRLPTRGF
jgi:hypothetical protein